MTLDDEHAVDVTWTGRGIPPSHEARYRGWRRCTVTCTCGWVQVDHRSRGRARRAFDRHLAAAALPPAPPYDVEREDQ